MRQVFDSLHSAVTAFRTGDPVILVDTSPDSFHGAFAVAARHVTAATLNVLLLEGRGALALALDQSICLRFGLRPQVSNRPDGKVFAIPFNLIDNGKETGQACIERVKAIKAIIDPTTDPASIRIPGYIQSIITTERGVLETPMVASAATDLARLSGIEPAVVVIEILNKHGELATLNELVDLAEIHHIHIITLEELVRNRSTVSLIVP